LIKGGFRDRIRAFPYFASMEEEMEALEVESVNESQRLVLRRMEMFLREGRAEDGSPRLYPVKVSVNWGKIMSAVLVGNLLSAAVAAIIYELVQ
jgi:hypothetical protein